MHVEHVQRVLHKQLEKKKKKKGLMEKKKMTCVRRWQIDTEEKHTQELAIEALRLRLVLLVEEFRRLCLRRK